MQTLYHLSKYASVLVLFFFELPYPPQHLSTKSTLTITFGQYSITSLQGIQVVCDNPLFITAVCIPLELSDYFQVFLALTVHF